MTGSGFAIERDETGGALVVVDGHAQSYVDLSDPTRLEFDYVTHLAAAIDALSPAGPLRVTHIGGAGLTLARWVAVTRPASSQVVLEPSAELTAAVRRELPLPRGHRIRVRPVTGEAGLAALRDASADVVLLDAYAGGRVPAALAAPSFLGACARVLAPDGVLLANLADEPGLRWVARVEATARGVLPQTAYIAATEVLKGRRFGNVVVVASRAPLDVDALRRAVARLPFPAGVLDSAQVRRRGGGARPFGETTAEGGAVASPEPPAAGAWRVR